jgi:hypothetical protein
VTNYKLSRFPNEVIKNGVSTIPFDPANTDYQAYLQWIEAGNQPEPADEPQGGE